MATYLHKQTQSEPLYPDIIWNKPENKSMAGKLLIIGGNLHGLSKVAATYASAQANGAGEIKVIMPDALKKTVGGSLPACEFVPSTPSGSFSIKAKNNLFAFINWADSVLMCGDFGRNSETAILLEQLLQGTSVQITLVHDALDHFLSHALMVLNRPNTTLILTIAELQALCKNSGELVPITFGMGTVALVDQLHSLTLKYPINLVINYENQILIAVNGEISSTSSEIASDFWRTETAAKSSIFWMQNPTKPFESLTTAII